jgi:hypothetical protein
MQKTWTQYILSLALFAYSTLTLSIQVYFCETRSGEKRYQDRPCALDSALAQRLWVDSLDVYFEPQVGSSPGHSGRTRKRKLAKPEPAVVEKKVFGALRCDQWQHKQHQLQHQLQQALNPQARWKLEADLQHHNMLLEKYCSH